MDFSKSGGAGTSFWSGPENVDDFFLSGGLPLPASTSLKKTGRGRFILARVPPP